MPRKPSLSLSALLAALFVPTAAAQSPQPGTLLVYYGYPSHINGANNVARAAGELGRYEYVVLGAGLERSDHADHANTRRILRRPEMASTRVFGYVDLGVFTANLPLSEVRARVDAWAELGASGILFDDFGYDYGTDRGRQNAAVSYVRKAHGLPVLANGHHAQDVFGRTIHPRFNPTGAASVLSHRDFYLYESHQVHRGGAVSAQGWRAKADALATYQRQLGFQILSVTTTDEAFDQTLFHYAWYSAALDGHLAMGWGEPAYAAATAQAPFYPRPLQDLGEFVGSIDRSASPIHRRATSTGQLFVDPSNGVAGFIPTQTSTGNTRTSER